MVNLSNTELNKISGGGISITLWYVIGGAATFIAGLISGFVNPKSCNK